MVAISLSSLQKAPKRNDSYVVTFVDEKASEDFVLPASLPDLLPRSSVTASKKCRDCHIFDQIATIRPAKRTPIKTTWTEMAKYQSLLVTTGIYVLPHTGYLLFKPSLVQ